MTTPTISLAAEAIPAASLPDLSIQIQQGEDGYTVTLQVDAAFSDAQIAACAVGASVAVSASGVTWTGPVVSFCCRSGHSSVRIEDAVCSH
ncbi:MAG TPA: hypothetical protein PKJ51_01830 [Methanothrix sp.]|jgi:hypothetical protein|nr:hypothetical protein [Methanothrix sp.]